MTTYVVKSGDSLTKIATEFHTTVSELMHLNPKITNPNEIYVNEVLTVSGGKTYGPVPVTPHPMNRIVAAAISRANATHSCRPGTCDHVCAGYYGFSASGYNTAYENALAVPQRYRHVGANMRAGMIGFWSGGSHHYGHAAMIMSATMIRSTDMDEHGNYAPGQVNTIPLARVHESWGLTFMFATDPYFQGRLVTIV